MDAYVKEFQCMIGCIPQSLEKCLLECTTDALFRCEHLPFSKTGTSGRALVSATRRPQSSNPESKTQ